MATKRQMIEISGLEMEVVRKAVKHMRVTVYPPGGSVRVSVPLHVGDRAVREAVTRKLGWIREKRQLVIDRARDRECELVTGASHWVWGRRCRLTVEETAGSTGVTVEESDHLVMQVRPGTSEDRRRAILDDWYRASLKSRVPALIERWEPVIGESIAEWNVKKMKTRWGSCNPRARRIWLGLELAKRSPVCTEYVLVHEMVHLIEASHSRRFYDLMDRFMPDWKAHRSELKRGLEGAR